MPVLGDLKFVTSSIFDIGVYLIVIGLVLDVLRSMGAELDRQGVLDRLDLDAPGAPARSAGEPMTTNLVLAITIGGLFAGGVYLMLSRNLIRVILGFLLAGHGINLLLLSVGGGRAADRRRPANGDEVADPIPQALILTSIVISLAVSTFLLAMAYRNYIGDPRSGDSTTTRGRRARRRRWGRVTNDLAAADGDHPADHRRRADPGRQSPAEGAAGHLGDDDLYPARRRTRHAAPGGGRTVRW